MNKESKIIILFGTTCILLLLFFSTPSIVHLTRMVLGEPKELSSFDILEGSKDCLSYEVSLMDMGQFTVAIKTKVRIRGDFDLLDGITVYLKYKNKEVVEISNVYGGTYLPDKEGYYYVFLWRSTDGGVLWPLREIKVCPNEEGWPVDGIIEIALSTSK